MNQPNEDECLVRIPEDSGILPVIPEDEYSPVYNYVPERKSAEDSIAGGHWCWRKVFIGYVGKVSGIMLGPEWAEVLEVTSKE